MWLPCKYTHDTSVRISNALQCYHFFQTLLLSSNSFDHLPLNLAHVSRSFVCIQYGTALNRLQAGVCMFDNWHSTDCTAYRCDKAC
jgi:hypothetical protein